ncbi:MAG: poly(R)-hydroxyalkanoic acid synthase subunit PhaE [Steroidobacteraceae bacterium]
MADDVWQQWRSFAALMVPPGSASQAPFAGDGAFAFVPFIKAAERFMTAARSYLEGTANASAPAAAEAARTFGDFLREQFAALFQPPWITDLAGAASAASSAFKVDMPALGPTREHQLRWDRTADAWRRTDDAQRRLQRLWSDVLRDAAIDFAARLGQLKPNAVGPEALHGLYDTWIDCAEETYARMAHSDAYCNALAEYVNAGSRWRQALQANIEQWAKPFDLPTRSEVNTLTLRLRSVEKELRAASKELKTRDRKPDEGKREQRKSKAAGSRARRGRRGSSP